MCIRDRFSTVKHRALDGYGVLALASIGLAGALHRVDREVPRTVASGSAGEGPSAASAGDLALGVDR